MLGGICRKKGVTTLGVTCPIRTAGHCFEPVVDEEPLAPLKETRTPRALRRGRGGLPPKPEDYKVAKTCIKCGAVKPLADFYRLTRSKDGRMNICKKCWDKKYHQRKKQDERA